jgi:malonate transporter MadL subunit
VGIAMLLLVLLANRFRDKLNSGTDSGKGVLFWSAMYIPIVVAMAARQNVIGALTGGGAAILAGVVSVVSGYLMVLVYSRFLKPKRDADE